MSIIKGMFKRQKSLEELEEENQSLDVQVSIAQKKQLIKELEARGKRWQDFSSTGTKRGINFEKIKAWLKGVGGTK